MKLVTFCTAEHPVPRLGVIQPASSSSGELWVVDAGRAERRWLGSASGCLDDMQRWLEGGAEAWQRLSLVLERLPVAAADELHLLSDVQLFSPLPRPLSIRDCLVFEGHWIQCARRIANRYLPLAGRVDRGFHRLTGRSLFGPPRVWYQRPLYYKGNCAAVIGTGTDVVWPEISQQLDFELEWGVFVGRRAADLSISEAAECIAGYAIFNDFTLRDVQQHEMAGRLGPAKSKDFDTGNAIGPWLTTADELPIDRPLQMEARVNGEVWCRATTADMHFTFAEILAFISRSETLYPGDFIASGTPANGCGWEQGRWLRGGDVVELSVEGLGTLRNRIARKA